MRTTQQVLKSLLAKEVRVKSNKEEASMRRDQDSWDIKYRDFTRTVAVYPKHMEVPYLALGLAGEAGEVADKIKKEIRDGGYLTAEIIKELGDVLWYLTRLGDAHNTTLQEMAEINKDKLSSRKDRDKLSGSGDNR